MTKWPDTEEWTYKMKHTTTQFCKLMYTQALYAVNVETSSQNSSLYATIFAHASTCMPFMKFSIHTTTE